MGDGTPLSVHGFGWSDVGLVGRFHGEVGGLGVCDGNISVINGLHSDAPVLDADTTTLLSGPTVRLRDNNDNKAVVAKLSVTTSTAPLEFGVSYYTGKWDTEGTKNLSMWGREYGLLAGRMTTSASHSGWRTWFRFSWRPRYERLDRLRPGSAPIPRTDRVADPPSGRSLGGWARGRVSGAPRCGRDCRSPCVRRIRSRDRARPSRP